MQVQGHCVRGERKSRSLFGNRGEYIAQDTLQGLRLIAKQHGRDDLDAIYSHTNCKPESRNLADELLIAKAAITRLEAHIRRAKAVRLKGLKEAF
jgi:hypothetical protein